jgi:nitrogen fixation protein NifB
LALVQHLKNTNLKIIGIAGPGDPFSEPDKLFTFIRQCRESFGYTYEFCISTNGLVLYKYLDLLRRFNVNFITLTINSLNPDTIVELVEFVKLGRTVYRGKEAAKRLLAGQLKSLQGLVKAGIRCKVNTVIVPDVNQYEISDLTNKIKEIGVEKGNLIPLLPVKGTKYEHTQSISIQEYEYIFNTANSILNQVTGCKKCRADAAFVSEQSGSTINTLVAVS